MDMIVIDKEFLKGYKSLLVGLENCDAYEIDIDDIQDVYCKAKLIGKKKNEYRTDDGFIKIAARASQTIEYSILRNQAMGTEGDIRLMERMQMCVGCADMTSFSLKDKNNQKTEIYVPYDSLEGVRGNEIELSNCPSFEVDEDGNMIIAFGKRSKQPKRKDNNYNELIAGWEEAFGDFCPKKLKVKINFISTFGIEKKNFSVCFNIHDKLYKKDFAELVFIDCKNFFVEKYFPIKKSCTIVMSKMADGQIYVGFEDLGLDFICSSVLEYDYYCNQNEK